MKGAFQQPQVHLHEVGVERQHHERQVDVDHADHQRERRVHHQQRLLDDAQALQQLVDEAVAVQQALPGVDAQQERRPERQHHQHHQQRSHAGGRACQEVGERVAQQQADPGRGERIADGRDVGPHVERVAEQEEVVRELEPQLQHAVLDRDHVHEAHPGVGRFGEADLEHDEEGQQEEHQQPGIGHADERPGATGAAAAGGRDAGGRHVRVPACVTASAPRHRCRPTMPRRRPPAPAGARHAARRWRAWPSR